jgi:integrase
MVSEGIFMHDFNAEFTRAKVTEAKQSRKILLPSQLEQFINFKPNPKSLNQLRAWTGGMLLADVGMRIDELLDLRLNDIEWKDSLIHIAHGKGNAARRVAQIQNPLSESGA